MRYQKDVPGAHDLPPTADHIISTACRYFEVEKGALACSKRGIENVPQDVAIYFVRLKTLAEVELHFSISK